MNISHINIIEGLWLFCKFHNYDNKYSSYRYETKNFSAIITKQYENTLKTKKLSAIYISAIK